MIRKMKSGIEWLEFELLQQFPNVVHGVFLRHGGVSEGPFASLNMGGGTNDVPGKIEQNRLRVQELLDLPEIISSKQVHGAQVKMLSDLGYTEEECDGIVTQQKNAGLMIKHADCQAAIFYDPILKAVANVHSGWRGNVQNIYFETVSFMRRTFGSKPEDLFVCISPSLGPEHAEFVNYKGEFPPSLWEFQHKPLYFDLWELSKQQLVQAGVLPHHIEIAKVCSYGNKEDFFSYRRDKVTGRNATIVALV